MYTKLLLFLHYKTFNIFTVQLEVASPNAGFKSVTLSINTTCLRSNLFGAYNITNLYLEAVEADCTNNCTIKNTSFIIQCDRNLTFQTVTIDRLEALTDYNISLAWISSINSTKTCKIRMFFITTASEENSDTNNTKMIALGVGISLPIIILFILTCIIIIVCICHRRKKPLKCPHSHSGEVQ